ncbi:PA2169 family four-helix-bundle protein [Mucilaginibacter sp. HMF5004]|uniref:ferritin-like domain-containing protein n=1 Tax=Mucilaginibacter rivuli TaxID=2857527 RepID=UPI001C5DF5E9|nr:PA2169 family four-helix-bundle protein [Mucilaginibacter rivuli]MBW4891149.1 PA2169 family four-helix-bundle protein [Mucilaginibacter rivuli]
MAEIADKKLTEQLQNLLSIANDSIAVYKKATNDAKGPEFTALFNDYLIQRSDDAKELKEAIVAAGGNPEQSGSVLGTLNRYWIGIKTTISSDEERILLEASESHDKSAIAEYDEVLKSIELSPGLRAILEDQRAGIEKALIRAEQLGRVYSS